jgi:homoserine dehydrogenase
MAGNRIERLCGILNGTCNYILTRMTEGGLGFDEALREAQAAGFAEADPSLDVDGHDAAQKLALLATVAFGVPAHTEDIHVEGIRQVTQEDIRAAGKLGYVIKHVATATADGLAARPVLVPRNQPLARVRNEQNSVLVRGDAAGEVLLQGAGAGGLPTAGSVLADLVEIARGAPPPPLIRPRGESPAPPSREAAEEFYLRFPIVDVPGVIGLIATALGHRGISIRHAQAELGPATPGAGSVFMLVHRCREDALQQALDHLAHLPVVRARPVALAVLGGADEGGKP